MLNDLLTFTRCWNDKMMINQIRPANDDEQMTNYNNERCWTNVVVELDRNPAAILLKRD